MSRRLVVGIGLLAIAAVAIVIALLVRAQPAMDVTPTADPSQSSKPAQSTLLIAVRNDAGSIVGAAVMGAQTNPDAGSWLSVQPGLVVDIDSAGTVPLATAGKLDPAETTSMLSNNLGIDIAGGWVMDRLAFAALVDSIGGVTVTLDKPLVHDADGKPGGAKETLAKPGKRRLYGPAAAEYVVTDSINASERMQRFNEVWSQIILRLPGNSDRVRSTVGSLGSSSRISISPDDIANTLLGYQTAVARSAAHSQVVPATQTGKPAAPQFVVDPAPMLVIVKESFARSQFDLTDDKVNPRIRMYSGEASQADLVAAQSDLQSADFDFAWGGVVDKTNKITVYVADKAHIATYGHQAAAALKQPDSAIQVAPERCVGVQASVVIGAGALNPQTASASTSSKS